MPTGCCGGSTCACQIIGGGLLEVEGSGLPTDPFVLSVEPAFEPVANTTFVTLTDGIGTVADPWTIEVVYASSARLDDIPDVNASSPTNGQVLAWNSATSRWVAQTGTTAATGAVQHDTSMTGDGSVGLPLAVMANASRYLGSFSTGIGLSDTGMTAAVHHYTNAAARTAALPSPSINTLSMLDSAPGVIQYWTGTSWLVLPNQTEWSASESLLELSGPYSPTLRPVVMVIQLDVTADGDGEFDVLGPADVAGRSGVLSVQVQETGTVAWKAMVFANTDRISATGYRLTDGSLMAGTPLTATVQAILY